jgi:hypothetical protein
MKLFVLVLLAAVLAAPAALAAPRTINVPADYSSIQSAINHAGNGDIVRVAPGTYPERINFQGKNITVTSVDPEDPCVVAATVIDAGSSGSTVTFDSGETAQAVLTGFTISGGVGTYLGRDGATSLYVGGGIYCLSSSPTIAHNLITENYGYAETSGGTLTRITYGGAIGCVEGLPTITRNIIKNNFAYAGAVFTVQGTARIISNLIYENSAIVGGGAVLIYGGELIGNTIIANDAEVAGNVYLAPDSALVSSNIIADAVNGGGVYTESGITDAFRYNDVFNNSPADYPYTPDLTGTNGNISADPCFADAPAYDFHIFAGSPCINAGQPHVEVGDGAKDMEGKDRVFAVRIDMGAYEYVGYLPPVADAGPDQLLNGIGLVTLDGSGSFFYDTNGVTLFHWKQTAGERVTLSDPCSVQPTFMPETEGRYKFELTVSDGNFISQPDEVLVVIGDYVPLAFPEAEGSGRRATGGRGGSVYKVTNLNNSGPGSIVDALSSGNRIIVFDVSGTIELKGVILEPKSHTTIAGQTAPGDGICIKGRFHILNVSDVVIRYIRIRVDAGAQNSDGDAIDIDYGKNIIIDHVSASYARDEGISCQEDSNDVTVQWCIISEGLTFESHSYGSLVRGQYGQRKTYHHNLYAHNWGRNPRPGNYLDISADPLGLFFDFRNNVVYNWKGNTAGYNDDSTPVSRYNFIGNVYVTGPESSLTGKAFRESARFAWGYFEDNSYNGVVPADPWSLVQFNMAAADADWYKERSYLIPMDPVTTTSPAQAKTAVLAGAGASFPKRDIIDARIVNDVLNLTGHSISNVNEQPEGGWPQLNSAPAPADSDNDGMPDYWEIGVCLDPYDANDAIGDRDNDGYTNIEEYINWLPTGEPMPPCQNRPPVAVAGPNQIAYAWIDGMADVNLDGSASYDDDNDLLSYHWSWTIDGNVCEANGISPTVRLPVGEHQIELLVDDGIALSEPNYCTVTVIPAMKAEMLLAPHMFNTSSKGGQITAKLALPDGISPADIDCNEPLVFYPGEIQSQRQRVFETDDPDNRSTHVMAFFDKNDCRDSLCVGNSLVQVAGKLTTGQCFYGDAEVTLMQTGPAADSRASKK